MAFGGGLVQIFGKAKKAEILRSIIAEGPTRPVADFDLSEADERELRRQCIDALDDLASEDHVLTGIRNWKKGRPFSLITMIVAAIVVAAAVTVTLLLRLVDWDDEKTYVFVSSAATVGAVAAAAVGWAVAGWVSHRNAVVQHTINLIFARVSQPTFAENIFIFNKQFGNGLSPRVFDEDINRLEASTVDDERKAAQSTKYILNYFEFIAAGVTRGDLDLKYVELTLRGQAVFYYDKCEPLIYAARKANPRALENFAALRDHFRYPPH